MLSATAYAERVVVDGINYETNDDNFTATVVASDGEPYKGALVIPASITYNNQTYDVTNIESTAFSYNGFITSVDIHAPITETGSMFSGCTSLTSVSLPETVTTIGSYAFSGCTSLASFTVDNNISTIAYGAFDGCESLEEFVIKDGDTPISLDDMSTMPVKRLQIGREINFTSYSSPKWNSSTLEYATISGNVKTVPDKMFNMCSSLKSLTIGDGVTTIGEWACSGCTSLTDITLPESVDSIGMNAFSYCSSLEEITVPSKMDYLASSLFEYCSALKDVTLPEGLKCIGENAFGWCEEIDTLRLPSTLETIDRIAFAECRGLEAIIMCNGVKTVGDGAFESCTSLEKVYYKGSLEEWLAVSSIGSYAFSECTGLTDVELPDALTEVSDGVLYNCTSLKSVTIPGNVTKIGSLAVYSNSIEKLTCLAVVPPALHILLPDINPDGSDSFGLSYNTKIYIPEGSLETYCNAPGWRIWATYFEEFVPSGINAVENANGNTSERHYDMSGKAVPPTAKGLHIVRGSDGKTRKVIVR